VVPAIDGSIACVLAECVCVVNAIMIVNTSLIQK